MAKIPVTQTMMMNTFLSVPPFPATLRAWLQASSARAWAAGMAWCMGGAGSPRARMTAPEQPCGFWGAVGQGWVSLAGEFLQEADLSPEDKVVSPFKPWSSH